MKPIEALSNRELREKVNIVLRYILSGGNPFEKVKLHAEVLKTLQYFKRGNLIYPRTSFMYILPYISRTLQVHEKQQILINHYSLLRQKFSAAQLKQLFDQGITCFTESDGENNYRIYLKPVTNHLEFEGSINLVFAKNDNCLFTFSFTFAPGSIFNCSDSQVIYISSIQGTKDEYENIRAAAKYFKENAIPLLLLKVLEAFAHYVSIKTCLGISVQNQLSYKDQSTYDRFYNNYDNFWANIGASLADGHYVFNFPLHQKPILEIAQSHRNRTLKKRKKLEEIYNSTLENFSFFYEPVVVAGVAVGDLTSLHFA